MKGVTSKIFSVKDNQQVKMSDSIMHTYHFTMSLNVFLECENKDKKIYKINLHIHTSHKCKLL